jgi:hypothetical protein
MEGGSYRVSRAGNLRRTEAPTQAHPQGDMPRLADGTPIGADGRPIAEASRPAPPPPALAGADDGAPAEPEPQGDDTGAEEN